MMLIKIDKWKLIMKFKNRDMLDLVARRLRCYESEIGTKQSFEYRGKYFYYNDQTLFLVNFPILGFHFRFQLKIVALSAEFSLLKFSNN